MANDQHSRDPIEELFREKAGDYDISYDEADWLKLEQRLDNWEAQHTRVNRWRWIAAACILIIALLSYFTYQNYSAIDRLSRQLAEERARTQNDAQTDNLANNGSEVQQITPDVGGTDSTGKPRSAANESEPQGLAEETASNEADDMESDPKPTTSRAAFAISQQMSRELFAKNHNCPGCLLVQTPDVEPGANRLINTTVPVSGDSGGPLYTSAIKPLESSPPSSSTATDAGYASQSRFSVGLVTGPDLSSVGAFSHFSQPGYKIGINAEYKLTDRLSISTGLGRSQVYYSVQNFSYTTGGGYSSSTTVIPHTDAVCAILDIPVTLKYDFLEMKRSRLFASTGLSTYIMLNEEYRFDYYGNAGNRPQEWNSRTGTTHWMSNLNISVGYEMDIARNWSIRAEPFVKLPIREVGWGQVELFSLGTSVSVNYRL